MCSVYVPVKGGWCAQRLFNQCEAADIPIYIDLRSNSVCVCVSKKKKKSECEKFFDSKGAFYASF